MLKADLERGRTYDHFEDLLSPSVYEALPDDWVVGMTDVIDSTLAIDQGRYHEVNFAGASVIAALGNLCGHFEFPFVFGGDGASFAVPASDHATAVHALRQISFFSRMKLGMPMRVGLATVSAIRANGHDIRMARYAVSGNASYAMFSGGGLKWFERQVKAGRFQVEEEASGSSIPDLQGLACDWDPFVSKKGTIVSLLVEPINPAMPAEFEKATRAVIDVVDDGTSDGSPVPKAVHARRMRGADNVSAATWDDIASNSDFRKFDDLLRLTVDCNASQVADIEQILQDASRRGVVRYGMHCQSHAVMTCLVPSPSSRSHLHFLDGRDGGYARAAAMLKAAA